MNNHNGVARHWETENQPAAPHVEAATLL